MWENPRDFFSAGCLKRCTQLTEIGRLPLIPTVPPQLLQNGLKKALHGLGKGSNKKWKNWRWGDHFSGRLPDESIKLWYGRKIHTPSRDKEEVTQYRIDAWTNFVDKLWGLRPLVLYSQRRWLIKWFPTYDPASLDNLEDTDRPWDFDHIHAQKYVSYKWNIPQVIKDWHGSIGNLRAWPFELNRSNAEAVPSVKLRDAGDEKNRFYLDKPADILEASFIGNELQQWQASSPDESELEANYLGREEGFYRQRLIAAITKRWVSLYQNWYGELCIKDLFGTPHH